MSLTDKEIIQIDATVITGALILLSVVNTLPASQMTGIDPDIFPHNDPIYGTRDQYIDATNDFARAYNEYKESYNKTTLSILTLIVIIPFAVSAIFSLRSRNKEAITTMTIGFVTIIVSISAIVILNQLDLSSKDRILDARAKTFDQKSKEMDMSLLVLRAWYVQSQREKGFSDIEIQNDLCRNFGDCGPLPSGNVTVTQVK